MRTLTTNAAAQVNQVLGHDPVLIVRIDWASGIRYYAPKDLVLGSIVAKGLLIKVGAFTSQRRVDNLGSVGTFSVGLSDIDSSIKTLLDSDNVEYVDVYVYQHFEGNAQSDLLLLYKGSITGPIEWSEAQLEFTFEIETRIRDQEIGFSADVDSIPNLNLDAVDQAWPLCFGNPVDVPALKLLTSPTAHLKFPFRGPRDATQPYVTDHPYQDDRHFYVQAGEGIYFPQGVPIEVNIGGVIFSGSFGATILSGTAPSDTFSVADSNLPKYINIPFGTRGTNIPSFVGDSSDPDINLPNIAWLSSPKSVVNCYVKMSVGGHIVYYRVIRQEGNKIWFNAPITVPSVGGSAVLGGWALAGPSDSIIEVARNGRPGWNLPEDNSLQILGVLDRVTWTFNPGIEVRQWTPDHKDVFVANLIPSNSVLSVCATRRGRDGTNLRTVIPSSYYTIALSDSIVVNNVIDTVTVHPTTITFFEPLWTYDDQGWSDQIYVTLISSVGPNTADIIKWIFQTYSLLPVDSASFSAIATAINNYPSNFYWPNKSNVVSTTQSWAWQARCALIIDDGQVRMKYLSIEPSVDLSIGETDVFERSTTLSYTPTEEIVTRFIGHYKLSYYPDRRFRKEIVYKENLVKFGLVAKDYEFGIYNNKSLVQKSVNFWGHRYANSWRVYRTAVLLKGIQLQVFDCVELNFSSLLGVSSIKTVVRSTSYKGIDDEVQLETWLPSVAGSTTVDVSSWLADGGDSSPSDFSANFIADSRDYQYANGASIHSITTAGVGVVPAIVTATGVPVPDTGDPTNSNKPANVDEDTGSAPVIADLYGNGFGSPPTAQGVVATPVGDSITPNVGDKVLVAKDNDRAYIVSSTPAGSGTTCGIIVGGTGVYPTEPYTWRKCAYSGGPPVGPVLGDAFEDNHTTGIVPGLYVPMRDKELDGGYLNTIGKPKLAYHFFFPWQIGL